METHFQAVFKLVLYFLRDNSKMIFHLLTNFKRNLPLQRERERENPQQVVTNRERTLLSHCYQERKNPLSYSYQHSGEPSSKMFPALSFSTTVTIFSLTQLPTRQEALPFNVN